jgi:hypothetical protein
MRPLYKHGTLELGETSFSQNILCFKMTLLDQVLKVYCNLETIK